MDRPLKVLLADDSPTQAAFLSLALKRKGYEVITARDGIEEVEAAYQQAPDLIISDILMPRLNGYQVCRLLKDDQSMRKLPIILLTSLEARRDHFWGLKSGADVYLNKTSNIDSMVESIERFIRERNIRARPRAEAEQGAVAGARSTDITGRVIELLDRRLFESTVNNDMGDLVKNVEDYRKTIVGVLEILSKVIDFDVGIILLFDAESREVFVLRNAAVGDHFLEEARLEIEEFARREGRLHVMPEETSLRVENSSTMRTGEGLAAAPVASRALQLLTSKTLPSGAIGLFSHSEKGIGERALATLGVIFKQVNMTVDYARLYERNKQLSITDGLTKVTNHRYFQEMLKSEFAKSMRHKSPLALIILDIDHFKKVNDSHGHQQGDFILGELARLLKKLLRGEDTISRYGGEEFTILMPSTVIDDGLRVAERVRHAIETHEFTAPGSPLHITVSMGVVAVPHPLVCTAAQMINAADQALYSAKRRGRNLVVESFQEGT